MWLGGLIAYFVSFNMDISFLIPFAVGNFIYIGASDLIPEVKEHDNFKVNLINFITFTFTFTCGILLMLKIKVLFGK